MNSPSPMIKKEHWTKCRVVVLDKTKNEGYTIAVYKYIKGRGKKGRANTRKGKKLFKLPDNVVIKTNGYKLKVSASRLELRRFPAMRRVKSLKRSSSKSDRNKPL